LELSEHSVHTERVKTGDRGMHHREGGWQANLDPTDNQDTNKIRKRMEKESSFAPTVKDLCGGAEKCI